MGDLTTSIRRVSKTRGGLGLILAVLIGLFLARLTMISLPAVILVAGGGAVLVITVLLQRTDILLYTWFILTSFIILIVMRFFPQYYGFLGTVLFWGMLSCILAAWAMDNVLHGRRFIPFKNVPLIATVSVFILWGTISVFTSTNVEVSIRRFSHIMIALGTTYMFYDYFSQNEAHIKKLLLLILAIVVFVSASTIVTAFNSLLLGEPIYKQLTLWFGGPNALGGLLCFCIPLILTAGLHLINSRILRVFVTILLLLALFFSFSRTAWTATLFSLAFLIHASRVKRPLLLLGVTLALVGIAWWFPLGGEDFFRYVTGERYSGRTTIWKAAWNMACDYPLFGVGPGNALELMAHYLPTPFYEVLGLQDTHSVSLRNAAEMGFVTSILRLMVIGLIIYNTVKIERTMRSQFLRLVCRGTTATFISVLIRGMGENGSFLTPFSAAEFHLFIPYMALALPFAAKNLRARESQASEGKADECTNKP